MIPKSMNNTTRGKEKDRIANENLAFAKRLLGKYISK